MSWALRLSRQELCRQGPAHCEAPGEVGGSRQGHQGTGQTRKSVRVKETPFSKPHDGGGEGTDPRRVGGAHVGSPSSRHPPRRPCRITVLTLKVTFKGQAPQI